MDMQISLNVLIVSALAFLTILLLAILGWRINIDKSGVSTSRDSGEKKKLSAHARCSSRLDGLNSCRKSYEFGFKRCQSTFATLAQQMNVYDELEEEAIFSAQESFARLLKSVLPDVEHYTLHREYLAYETMLVAIFSEISTMVRRWFKNNHYSLKDTEEQLDYVKSKKELVIQKVWKLIDRWWTGELVTRAILAEAFDRRKDDWKGRVEKLFTQAFEIARINADMKEAAELHYCQYVESTFGEEVKIIDDSTVV